MNVVLPYIHTYDSGMELRYMLRSLKNITNFDGEVIVVGDREKWFTDKITHVQARRQSNKPYLDQTCKMLGACNLLNLGEEFIAMYDDVYITEPTEVGVYKLEGELRATKPSIHQRSKQYTADKLKEMGSTTVDYETHAPMLVNTSRLVTILKYILDDPKPHMLQWRSMYGNLYRIEAELFEDKKTKTQQLKQGAIISTNIYTPELHKLFPEPSIYEN